MNAYAARYERFKGKAKKNAARGSQANPKASYADINMAKTSTKPSPPSSKISGSNPTTDVPNPDAVEVFEGGNAEFEDSPLIIKRKRKAKNVDTGGDSHKEDEQTQERRPKKGKR
jgi:hypothetical protein